MAPSAHDTSRPHRHVTIGHRPLRYRLTRHPRQRRIRLWVAAEGIRVSAPRSAPIHMVEAAIRRHSAWLEREARALAPARAPGEADVVPILGERLRVRLLGGRPSLSVERGEAHLPPGDPAQRLVVLERLYRRAARERFAEICDRFEARMGVRRARLRITDTASRWGSCSSTGTISLSWRLLMAPSGVCEAVCAHEIVHLRIPNHSRRFRAALADLVPHVDLAERWLDEYGRSLARGPVVAAALPDLAEIAREAV